MIPSANEFYDKVEEMADGGYLEDRENTFRQLLLRGIALLAFKLEELAAVIAAEK